MVNQLVLSRNDNEEIVIRVAGQEVRIRHEGNRGKKTKLRFFAEPEVRILRGELADVEDAA